MVGMGVSKMGSTSPVAIPVGTKANGEKYRELIENLYIPQMPAIAFSKGKEDSWAFQRDNAAARTAKPVTHSIRRSTPGAFYPWPSRSPDLNILDCFTWNAVKQFLESMDPPPRKEAELRAAIFRGVATIPQSQTDAAIDQLVGRCEECLEAGGARFEYRL